MLIKTALIPLKDFHILINNKVLKLLQVLRMELVDRTVRILYKFVLLRAYALTHYTGGVVFL